MTEEEVSVELFLAASRDPDVEVLSWQSIDGKNYFAFDIKLRLSNNERMEPDLIVLTDSVWMIEVKGPHSDALADEGKLVKLIDDLGEDEVRSQIGRRAGLVKALTEPVRLAVAYGEDDLGGDASSCEGTVAHIEWATVKPTVDQHGLAELLSSL